METIEHDARLTDLIEGQYRILHDSQKILVPVGMSTTRPLAPETVLANLKIYGEINQSYFVPPWVDFINTEVVTKRFDRYKLGIFRPGEDLPDDNSDIDYHDDIGLNDLKVRFDITFTSGGIIGVYSGTTDIIYRQDRFWLSEILHFDFYNNQRLVGDFYVCCNSDSIPFPDTVKVFSLVLPTGKYLQDENLLMYVCVERAQIINGNSAMPLTLKNTEFPVTLTRFEFEVIGGE